MGFFKMKKRCPFCASELKKDGTCDCEAFKAVEAAKKKREEELQEGAAKE